MGNWGTGAEALSASESEAEEELAPRPVPPAAGERLELSEWLTDDSEPDRSRWRVSPLAVLLSLLAIGWTAAVLWPHVAARQIDPAAITGIIALLSGPLALLALLWLMLGRRSERESERFRESVAKLTQESLALNGVLDSVAERLDSSGARLHGEAARLMSFGEEAADRLGRVTHYLARETAAIDDRSNALEAAAANARVDIGVLLTDLPRAEEQARAVGEAMREAGLEAHGRAGALESQMASLSARAREADELAGGAAERLGAQIARIESNAVSANGRIAEAAGSMTLAVDEAMERASEALEASRAALDTQAETTLAAISHNHAALEETERAAAAAIGERLTVIQAALTSMSADLAAQDRTSRAMLTHLDESLAALEGRFQALTESGSAGAELLNQSFGTVRACVGQLFDELGSGHERAGLFIDRSEEMAQGLARLLETLEARLPPAFDAVEEQAGRTGALTEAIVPRVAALQEGSRAAAERLGAIEGDAARQEAALGRLAERIEAASGAAEAQLRQLGTMIDEADRAAGRISGETASRMVESMLRVREAASLAAERAREAISAVIPESAEALAEASGEALSAAIDAPVRAQIEAVQMRAEEASEAARKASERLTRQLVRIGEAAAAVDAQIERAERERQDRDAHALSRRVDLIVESLHSTAIDVAKILSNEVTDTAWAAYLKGDRGVFTRRAVRLLDHREAREVLAHYEAEPEFREQVNRYVHDFEALIQRLLEDRDGSALATTLLSSDMGKLYVALAQAIERLR